MPARRTIDLALYLVTDPELCRAHGVAETVRAAVAGGVTAVQLRDKTSERGDVYETALALKAALDGSGVPLIVNDHVDIAMAVGAEGVHVGQTDMPPEAVRRLVGPDVAIGFSTHNEAEIARLDPDIVDYAGLGPFWPTGTKANASPALTPSGRAPALRRLIPVPTVAIGGITADRVPDAMASGVEGVAVVSAICGTPDPQGAARALRQAVDRARERQDA